MTSSDLRKIQVHAFFPADHATVENGKLYVNGGAWNQLTFPTYPQVLVSAALVAVLEVPFTRLSAEHTLTVRLEDRDGQQLPFRAEGRFRVGVNPLFEYGDPTVMPLALPTPNLLIPKAGAYTFILLVDGEEIARFRITAIQPPTRLEFTLEGPGAPPSAET